MAELVQRLLESVQRVDFRDERVERKLDLLLRERGLEPQDVDAVVRGELDGRIDQR